MHAVMNTATPGLADSSSRGLRIGNHVRIEDSSDKRYGAIGRICKLQNSRFGIDHSALIAFDEMERDDVIDFKRVALDAYGRHKKSNVVKPIGKTETYRGA
jgi:hypothetical protein